MLREVVSTLTGLFIVEWFMYYMIPLTTTTHTKFSTVYNATDPNIATSYSFAGGFLTALPLIPFVVAAFILITVALRRPLDE